MRLVTIRDCLNGLSDNPGDIYVYKPLHAKQIVYWIIIRNSEGKTYQVKAR